MRLLIMVVLAWAPALSAQGPAPDASAAVKQFSRNLENAMKVSEARAQLDLAQRLARAGQTPSAIPLPKTPGAMVARSQPCAIPLLRVGPDASFHSKMPLIPPDPKAAFAAEVISPAPVCQEQVRK